MSGSAGHGASGGDQNLKKEYRGLHQHDKPPEAAPAQHGARVTSDVPAAVQASQKAGHHENHPAGQACVRDRPPAGA